MIAGTFALILIFGIVGALAFLREKAPDSTAGEVGVNAVDFDITEHE